MEPTRRHTTLEIRQLIIRLYSEGKTVREIGEIVCRSHSTVHDIIKKYRYENTILNKPRHGQGKLLNIYDERRILREIKINQFQKVYELKNYTGKHLGKSVCAETIRNTLRNSNFHGRIIRKNPFISPKNKKN